jgi:hypothetical protein
MIACEIIDRGQSFAVYPFAMTGRSLAAGMKIANCNPEPLLLLQVASGSAHKLPFGLLK